MISKTKIVSLAERGINKLGDGWQYVRTGVMEAVQQAREQDYLNWALNKGAKRRIKALDRQHAYKSGW